MTSKKQSPSMGYSESDAEADTTAPRPIHDDRIGRFKDRLREDIGDRGVREYASATRISEGALFSYLKGATYPTLDRLDALAFVAQRPVEWFLSIDTAPDQRSQVLRLDPERLQGAFRLLSAMFEAMGGALDPVNDADLIAMAYDALDDDDSPLTTSNVIDLAQRIRARREGTGSEKGPAGSIDQGSAGAHDGAKRR